MHPFNALHQKFRDRSRDRLCAALQDLGIPAQMADRGRPEEKITRWRGYSFGVIDIANGPIRWVNIKSGTDDSPGSYDVEYGIPDLQINATFPAVHIVAVRVKKVPVIGKVIDLRWESGKVITSKWEGKDLSLSIINRLTGDESLRQPIIDSYELVIEAYPNHGCWLLTVQRASTSETLWNCYQSIAHHLLARNLQPTDAP